MRFNAEVRESDFLLREFRFTNGRSLPELRLHVRILGDPAHPAVLLLHGTTGSGEQFLRPSFAEAMFGKGQPLDTTRYYVIIPDSIGHGRSGKPSDGLRTRFPAYGYHDLVQAQHRLVTEHLGIQRLRLVLGTSMGGMQTWLWGEKFPELMDGLVPVACEPAAISGRNLLWRRMLVRAIRQDPAWRNGDYREQPYGLTAALPIFGLLVESPLYFDRTLRSCARADAFLEQFLSGVPEKYEANDLLYALEASHDYDPGPALCQIQAPLLAINFDDDEINPPQSRILERTIPQVKHGKMVRLPAGENTRGHFTLNYPELWGARVAEFLQESERPETAPNA